MTETICWVETVAEKNARGAVKRMYDPVRQDGSVRNLYRAGSLFPQPVAVADALYKSARLQSRRGGDVPGAELARYQQGELM